MQLTPELAQEIASDTTSIIGLNVLITDREAVVIGSGDLSRVGSVHEASVRVLETLEPATHTADQARLLRGVKPGITLPIVLDGTAVGTVGLTGTPRRVERFGQVVRRQTEILLRESVLVRSRLLRERALEDLLRDIAFFDAAIVEPAAIAGRAVELGLDIRLPRTAVVIEISGTPETSPIRTVREVFGDPQDAVAEMTASRFAVLHRGSAETPCARAVELLAERNGLRARAGFGLPATTVAGLHESYLDAVAAVRLGRTGRVSAIADLRVEQLLAAAPQLARQRFTATVLGALRSDPALRATVVAWCESGFNLVRAAGALHIHRNTLLNRLDKISKLTGRPVRTPAEGIALYLACVTSKLAGEVS
ncbi:carbohydrate diacid regulator [Amycolatopsis xylanica]|uniref:Carbohydrate diacid regulator n=1 Tax=Amycolatopsis xylanica TaxID=589385 RepID=A0A1H3QV06_9PSEU|nr:sugar diacid recognition domain-containing protein [Amycolatopsis xylanica]SDZ17364.1 carbohydrate diacid regulator [Amycolatopsis xylanica]